MHSILSSRVLLNLRQAAAAPAIVDTTGITDATHYGGNSQVLFQPWATIFVQTEQMQTSDLALRDIRPHSSDFDDE